MIIIIILETKLHKRNFTKGMKTGVVHLAKYSGPFLKWTREELQQMDQRTTKLMAMHVLTYQRRHR